MTNAIEIASRAHREAEAAFEASRAVYKQAAANWKRSKKSENRIALVAAGDAMEKAASACREAQGRVERAYTVAVRITAVAGRKAARERQTSLFD